MKVKLSYFKLHGKWYSDGEYDTKCQHLHQIWEEVQSMNKYGGLPGLVKESKNWIILIDVPEHEHNHPHLIVPTRQILLREIERAFDEHFEGRE